MKNFKHKIAIAAAVALLLSPLAGCTSDGSNQASSSSSSITSTSSSKPNALSKFLKDHSSSSSQPASNASSQADNSQLQYQDSTQYPSQARSDQAIAPIRGQFSSLQFNGAGAYIVNNNQSTLGDVKPYGRPWAQNHPDSQGRAAEGDAYLTRQARQYRNRAQTGNGASNWKPAGYQQAFNLPGQYRFAYNRGHLLGYALVGNIQGFNASESNPQNIATQTMWANQAREADNTGQNYYEGIVRKALDQNKFVRYQVKDIYAGNEQVPRAMQIQAKSSDGTVNFNVLVPNTQNNILINYANGQVTRCQ